MDWGRIPACHVMPLAGEHTTSGHIVLNRANSNNGESQNQPLLTGNRCDHDRNNFKRPNFHRNTKKRPHVLEEAKRRLIVAIENNFRFADFTGVFYHSAADNGSGRRRRSESIEGSLSLTLTTLLHALNLHKMACGHYDNKKNFQYLNYAYIEDRTSQKASRIKRAMKLLQYFGIIKVTSLREKNNDGSWRTKEVRIEFTDKIFEMLELSDEFLTDRERAGIKHFKQLSEVEQKRRKLEIYKKPNFDYKKPSPNQVNDVKSLTAKLMKPPTHIPNNHGLNVRDKLNALVRGGMSVADAMKALSESKPPPH